MKWRWGIVVAGLLVAGCSANVGGIVGSEKFTGSVQQGMDGRGTMTLSGDAGTRCIGNYRARSTTGGDGSLSCNDGRAADIQYATTSVGVGYGYGTTNTGAPVRFYFGMNAEQGAQYLAAATTGSSSSGSQGSRPRGSSGTGFFVTRQGHVVTNAHVVDSCASITIQQQGMGSATAQLVAADKQNDLALLRVDTAPSAIAPLRGNRPVRPGENIVAYGFPLNGLVSSGGILTTGTVSALAGLQDDTRYFQISAPLQPGNSGGPLLDMTGTVIGVNTLSLTGRASGTPYQNVNFAIKSDVVRTFLATQGVSAESGPSRDLPGAADIGERARTFTVLIKCMK